METAKTKYTAETIRSKPIDMAKLEAEATQMWNEGNVNVSYKLYERLAIVSSPKLSIINDEFIGNDIDPKEAIKFLFYKNTKTGEHTGTMEIMPSKGFAITMKELEDYLLPETSLAEFTKNRRHYNSRIDSNEYSWMKHFNS